MSNDDDEQQRERQLLEDQVFGALLDAVRDRERAEAAVDAAVMSRQRWQRAAHKELGLSMREVADRTVAALEAQQWDDDRIDRAGVRYPAVRRAVERLTGDVLPDRVPGP